MPIGGMPREQSAGRVVTEVERPDVAEAALLVVAVETDVVGPHIDPDPVVAKLPSSLAGPLDHVGAES